MEIIIHRGTHQIGGCVTEIKTEEARMRLAQPRKRSLRYPASRFPLRWTAKRIKMKMHR